MQKVRCIVWDSDGVVNSFYTKKFNERFEEEFPEHKHIMNFFRDGAYGRCRKGLSTVEEEFLSIY